MFGALCKPFHLVRNGFRYLFRLHAAAASRQFLHPFLAKHLVPAVAGLRQSVRVEQQRCSGLHRRFLHFKPEVAEQSYGQVGHRRQRFVAVFAVHEHRHLMAGITVAQAPCRQVEHAHKHRHKHVRPVVPACRLVHAVHDFSGRAGVRCNAVEQRFHDTHDEGGRNPFSADVANAEEQLFVADEEVVQVAAHLACRGQRAVQPHVVRCQSVFAGQHLSLNVLCYLQLPVNALLFHLALLQAVPVFGKLLHNES